MITLLICGLGRCGSSLVMQMLAAGGFPTTGLAPGYEDHHTDEAPMRERAAWYRENQGRAIKVLDPHRNRIPGGIEYRAVWLDRNVREQARSQLKFANALGEAVDTSRRNARAWEGLLRKDRGQALVEVHRAAGNPLFLDFEELLAAPRESAAKMAAHAGAELDLDAMAAVVRKRGPECLPYLLEHLLVAEARGVEE